MCKERVICKSLYKKINVGISIKMTAVISIALSKGNNYTTAKCFLIETD